MCPFVLISTHPNRNGSGSPFDPPGLTTRPEPPAPRLLVVPALLVADVRLCVGVILERLEQPRRELADLPVDCADRLVDGADARVDELARALALVAKQPALLEGGER